MRWQTFWQIVMLMFWGALLVSCVADDIGAITRGERVYHHQLEGPEK